MSTSEATAPALAAVEQNRIFVSYAKKNSTPRFNSVLQAQKSFVQSEINRKHSDACYALMTDAQIQKFELGAESLKDFFRENSIPNFPAKNEFQTEMKTMRDSWDAISAKSIKVFTKKLKEISELRDIKIVFDEIYETYQNDATNDWKNLLA